MSLPPAGTCRPCLIDVVPVKKAEGQVIMFILNFQEIIDPSLKKPGLRQRVAQGWVWAGQCGSVCVILSVCLPVCLHQPVDAMLNVAVL